MGPAGPIGLDYGVVHADRVVRSLDDTSFEDLMDRLRIIEGAALEIIYRK